MPSSKVPDMQVHRQRCQNCHSIEVRNIIVRDSGKPTVVYVRCSGCGELVACYELQRYYHHGKGVESYLRGHGVGAADSARAWLAEFQKVQEDAVTGYQAALKQLTEENKEI